MAQPQTQTKITARLVCLVVATVLAFVDAFNLLPAPFGSGYMVVGFWLLSQWLLF